MLNRPINAVYGIGEVKARAYQRLGIFTVRDLLYHIPRAYQNRGHIVRLIDSDPDERESFILTVSSTPTAARLKKRMSIVKFKAFDESADAEITYFNQDYLKSVFTVGMQVRFFGKADRRGRKFLLSSPEYEIIDERRPLRDFFSVYPLTSGLSEKVIAKNIESALSEVLPTLVDPLPTDALRKYGLPTLSYALKNIHFPETPEALAASLRRLSFDEFFYFALAMSQSRSRLSERCAPSVNGDVSEFILSLPYELTGAQMRSVHEILDDMASNEPTCRQMNRILTGDVGSGKTVCAAAAIFAAVNSGYQAAVMVPTEILAHQHFEEFSRLLSPFGIKIALLTGSTPTKEKNAIYKSTENGDIDLLIGTHALLSDRVSFKSLALTVTDEQHRFGVMQRARLKDKSAASHTLVMSATPIPRTMALTLYGDLDISRIDEMPPNRQRVDTFLVDESYRARLNAFIDKQINEGGQVYIVCPAIEERGERCEVPLEDILEGEKREAPPLINATDHAETLRTEVFPNRRTGLLHGKLKPSEKDAVMSAFSTGGIDILVSTTVVEVGVNVPNASLMIIENAERFGLSQLHQLRGRVGRGTRKSYCILISNAKGDAARARLNTISTTYDGYAIAEQDLAQRGPGDFFASLGTDELRQSGGFSFKLSERLGDTTTMQSAAELAKELSGTQLSPELAAEVQRLFNVTENTIS